MTCNALVLKVIIEFLVNQLELLITGKHLKKTEGINHLNCCQLMESNGKKT